MAIGSFDPNAYTLNEVSQILRHIKGDLEELAARPLALTELAARIDEVDCGTGGGVGVVTSVAAANGTLTISPTTGDVLAARAAISGDVAVAAGSNTSVLATVNANVGTFGSATAVATPTVNAKGLITAISNTTIAIPSTGVTDFTEAAQDAVGAMVNTTLTYVDATPLLGINLNNANTWTQDITLDGINALVFENVNTYIVAPSNGNMVIHAATQVHIDGTSTRITALALDNDLAVSEGGTGASTAQDAINTLTAVAGATNEHVLTKDTATGNAIFKAAAGGGGTPTVITVANEATDTTCFPLFVTAATGDLGPKTNAALTFNSNSGALGATTFNKVTITAPATAATLTLIDGTTLTGPAASGTAMTLGNAETVTGVKTLGTTTKLQFRDTGLYINSAADGELDIVSDSGIVLWANSTTYLNSTGIRTITTFSDSGVGSENYLAFANATTSGGVGTVPIAAQGTAANIHIDLQTAGTGVAKVNGVEIATSSKKLSFFAATSSAELAGVISDETGSGALVFATSPTLVTPVLGTVAAGSILTNATGLPPAGLTSAARRQTRLCRIDTPIEGDAFQIVGIPDAATIKVVRHIHVGGTSVVFNIEHRAEATPFTTSATVVWTAPGKTTSTTSTEETSFNDATVAASIVLTVVIGTVTGTVSNMLIVVEYEAD